MKFTYPLAAALFGTVAIVLVQPHQQVLAQTSLSSAQVGEIARKVTVLIEGQNPGSGVIIRREGNTYTVLTARHVVATPDEYTIVTPDGHKYRLNYNTVKPFPGADLATLEFTSTQVYTVAKLGNSRTATSGTPVYVAGFPAPTAAINQSVFNFTRGEITANSERPLADGYALVYSNNTLPGMSGGPVLNAAGQVIGIHGKGDVDSTSSRATANPGVALKTGFNLAIPINTFLSLAGQSRVVGFVAPPSVSRSNQPTADDYYLQAGRKFEKKDYRGAIADLDQAIRLNPNYAVAYNGRGDARRGLQDYRGAIVDYDQAIRLNPNFADAYANRGAALIGMKDYQGAIADTDQAIRLDSNNATAYNNRGVARGKLKDYRGAIADFEQAIRLDPNKAEAYGNRGSVRNLLKDFQKAIADFDQAIRLDPNLAFAYNNRGVARSNLKDYQGEIADYDQVIRLNPNHAHAYKNRGVARVNLGDRQGALVDLQKAAHLAQAQGNQQLYEAIMRDIRLLQR